MRATLSSRKTAWVAAALVGTWALVLFVAWYPGMFGHDALVQLEQGRLWRFNNHHPVVLSALAGLLPRLGLPVSTLLALQLLAVGGGLALCVRPGAWRSRDVAALAIALALPPVWSQSTLILKDVAFGASLLMASALWARGQNALTVAALIFAGTLRHNGIAVVAVWAVAVALAVASSRARVAAVVISILGASVAAPRLAEWALNAREGGVGLTVVFQDLVDVYRTHPQTFSDSPFVDLTTAQELSDAYSKVSYDGIISAVPGGPRGVRQAELLKRKERVLNEWKRLALLHPWAIVEGHFERFLALLGVNVDRVQHPFYLPAPTGIGADIDTLAPGHVFLRSVQEATRDSLLFRGWFWVLGCACVTVLAVRQGPWRTSQAFWLGASGLANAFVYLAAAPVADFRFLFATVVAALGGALSLFCAKA